MITNACSNRCEQYAATLARVDSQLYNYYFKENAEIVEIDSIDAVFVEKYAKLSAFFHIITQRDNLEILLHRVRSLNEDESKYDQDTRDRMCNWIQRKFETTIDIHIQILETSKIVFTTLDLPTLLARVVLPNILAKRAKRDLQNNAATCSQEARIVMRLFKR